jgi:polyisoprenoid-binding protein YceI
VAAIPLSPTGVWKIDTGHTQIGFSIRHLGISTVHGFFAEYSGHANIGADLDTTSVELSASTGSINTGNTWRDGHLVGTDFFDSENFPEMTFRSTSIVAAGDKYTLAGDLTVKDTTKPVSFDLSFNGVGVFPVDDSTHAGFLATTTVRRSDFGVSYGIPVASDEVEIRIDAQLIAPVEEAPG